MSQYGTHPEYERGYNDAADETAALYDDLVEAAKGMCEAWGKEFNLTARIQALDKAVKGLKHRRLKLET
jgi:hypothetical protein